MGVLLAFNICTTTSKWPFLCVSANSAATERSLDSFLELASPYGHIEIVHFTEDASPSRYPHLHFNVRLFHYIKIWASVCNTALHIQARLYLEYASRVEKLNEQAKFRFAQLELQLSKMFLSTVVRGVFTDYPSSGHTLLRPGFAPKILALDQIDQIIIPLALLPAGYFSASVKLFLGVGDQTKLEKPENAWDAYSRTLMHDRFD